MIPTYTFLQRDAALRDEPKKFCDALIRTGRFFRDDKAIVHFKIADGDYVRIDHKRTLREILLSGEAITIAGDELDDSATGTLWLWFTSRRWTFPKLAALTTRRNRLGVGEEYARMCRR